MPRINNRGQAVMGASGVVSVDGAVLVGIQGWLAQWLDDDRIIYSGDRVECLNVNNGEVTILHGRGVNNLAAGGGQWLGWNPQDGLIGSLVSRLGGTSPPYADGRGAIGRDGTLAYVPDRQVGTPTILRAPDGSTTPIQAATYGLQVLGPSSAIWTGGSLNAPIPPAGAVSPRIYLDWMVYFKDGLGLVAHLIGTNKGKILTSGVAFNHDACEVNGDVFVCWSLTSGEGPNDLRKAKVSDFPLVNLDDVQPAPPHLEPIGRDFAVLWYEMRGVPPRAAPGNGEVAVRGFAPNTTRPHPVIVTDDSVGSITGLKFAYRVGSEAADQNDDDTVKLQKMVARANELHAQGYRIDFYWDMPADPPFWPALPAGSIYQLEGFRRTTQTLEQWEAELDARVGRACEHYPYVTVSCQSHTTNTSLTKDLRSLIPGYLRLPHKHPRLIGFEPFCHFGRHDQNPQSPTYNESGMIPTNEFMRPYWEQIMSGITGFPQLDGGGGGGTDPVPEMNIILVDYPRTYARNNPRGWVIALEVEGPRPVLEIWVEQAGTNDPQVIKFNAKNDGRYWRVFGIKLVHDGTMPINVTAIDDQGTRHTVATEPVTVTSSNGGGGGPEPPADLDDQTELVKQLRKTLFPNLFQPGHPDANGDGYLRIDRDQNGNSNTTLGLERGALWAKHLAWRLRGQGVGLARAKPGSGNHGGPTQAVPEGVTTDIVALSSGEHWDFQIDSAGGGYPQWAKEEDPANYPPIAARFIPAFDPSTP